MPKNYKKKIVYLKYYKYNFNGEDGLWYMCADPYSSTCIAHKTPTSIICDFFFPSLFTHFKHINIETSAFSIHMNNIQNDTKIYEISHVP